jgi:hypothetical protein
MVYQRRGLVETGGGIVMRSRRPQSFAFRWTGGLLLFPSDRFRPGCALHNEEGPSCTDVRSVGPSQFFEHSGADYRRGEKDHPLRGGDVWITPALRSVHDESARNETYIERDCVIGFTIITHHNTETMDLVGYDGTLLGTKCQLRCPIQAKQGYVPNCVILTDLGS